MKCDTLTPIVDDRRHTSLDIPESPSLFSDLEAKALTMFEFLSVRCWRVALSPAMLAANSSSSHDRTRKWARKLGSVHVSRWTTPNLPTLKCLLCSCFCPPCFLSSLISLSLSIGSSSTPSSPWQPSRFSHCPTGRTAHLRAMAFFGTRRSLLLHFWSPSGRCFFTDCCRTKSISFVASSSMLSALSMLSTTSVRLAYWLFLLI